MKCTGKNCPLELGKVEKCTVHNCKDRTKPTNFDKITESVESLARFIEKQATRCTQCPLFNLNCKIMFGNVTNEMCVNEIKEWLQQEAE